MVLIETLWNVKMTFPLMINRQYIVLIETLWNVKLSAILESSSSILVLIETLWNVKLGKTICEVCVAIVLIETLWNVKKDAVIGLRSDLICINRNIVECKDLLSGNKHEVRTLY